MTTRAGRILSFVCMGAPLLHGQQGRVAGPTSGFVFDGAARVVRPIRGIPGASFIGDPVDFGFALAAAYVAPRQDSAIVAGADGSLHVFRLNSGTVAERAANGLWVPQRVVFSPSGTAAGLYGAGIVQVVTGLPDAPALGGTVDLGGAPAGSLALSDDGAFVLLAAGGSIRLLGTSGENRSLMNTGAGALVAFAPGGHDAAVADPTGAGLVAFRDVTGAVERRLLAAPDDGIASPAGLAFSADGRRLFLASSAARSVVAFDLAAGKRAAVACDCAVTGLVPMGNLFRLNEPGAAPLWLLDAGAAEPRIVFVPPAAPPIAN
jgi:hypothetical protein